MSSLSKKYNPAQRAIANQIYRLIEQQTILRRKWFLLDIKINVLAAKLDGLYERKPQRQPSTRQDKNKLLRMGLYGRRQK